MHMFLRMLSSNTTSSKKNTKASQTASIMSNAQSSQSLLRLSLDMKVMRSKKGMPEDWNEGGAKNMEGHYLSSTGIGTCIVIHPSNQTLKYISTGIFAAMVVIYAEIPFHLTSWISRQIMCRVSLREVLMSSAALLSSTKLISMDAMIQAFQLDYY